MSNTKHTCTLEKVGLGRTTDYDYYECSNCGADYAWEECEYYKLNYCPNCGAKVMNNEG